MGTDGHTDVGVAVGAADGVTVPEGLVEELAERVAVAGGLAEALAEEEAETDGHAEADVVATTLGEAVVEADSEEVANEEVDTEEVTDEEADTEKVAGGLDEPLGEAVAAADADWLADALNEMLELGVTLDVTAIVMDVLVVAVAD